MDTRSPHQRRRIMQAVKGRDTGPEILLRRLLHRMGLRYRLHAKKLPGRPDIVFPARKVALFVHGCFWHGHNCRWGKLPKSRLDYWEPKIAGNRERDSRQVAALEELGWHVLTVWQCELRDPEPVAHRVASFVENIQKADAFR